MLIRIGKFDITECWDGVFYKKLSRYPEITAWEIQTVLDFIRYEKDNGRTCTIEADRKIINAIDRYRHKNPGMRQAAFPGAGTENERRGTSERRTERSERSGRLFRLYYVCVGKLPGRGPACDGEEAWKIPR